MQSLHNAEGHLPGLRESLVSVTVQRGSGAQKLSRAMVESSDWLVLHFGKRRQPKRAGKPHKGVEDLLCVPKTLNPTIVVMKSAQDGA
jgi:hypothetical protein